ncbi:lectin-like [Sebastes umbrosus]|uniref:lectin-like n=1 Tax=Sebastes umbrosus TaxID=72105 RepID=UPI00189C7C85|nr:lectin-like [Sebastes umbrosus]
MRPAVVTAVLLLVGVLDAVTAQDMPSALGFCERYPDMPCDGGWIRIDDKRCAKLIETKKTFQDAHEHCENTFDGNLVSLHGEDEMISTLCMTLRADPQIQTVWIGGKKSGGVFTFNDGSKFNYPAWKIGEPDNAGGDQDCVEADMTMWGFWSDAPCSEVNSFVCAKNM